MREFAKILGKRLKIARKSAKFTIEQMAGKLGVGRRSISSYEASESTIPAIIVYKYAKICGYTVESFFNEDPDAPLTREAEIDLLKKEIENLKKNRYRLMDDDKEEIIKGIAEAIGK